MRKKYKSMKRKTKKLKVDVVNRYYYPVVAGIETLLTNVYPHLACKGWDVNIHVSKNTLSQKKILKDEEEINKVKVKRYYLGLFGFSPKIDWQNTSIVNIFNFDVFPHVRILLYCLILKYLGMKKFTLILSPQGGFRIRVNFFIPKYFNIKQYKRIRTWGNTSKLNMLTILVFCQSILGEKPNNPR